MSFTGYAGSLFNKAFYISSARRQELISQDKNPDKIIKPLLRGREIKRWVVDGEDNWLINPHNGLKNKSIDKYDSK